MVWVTPGGKVVCYPSLMQALFILSRRALLYAGLSLALSSCGDDESGTDAGFDAQTGDASSDAIVRDAVVTEAGVDASVECNFGSLPSLTAENIHLGESFEQPLFITQAPGDSSTLWVVEKAGRIRLIQDGSIVPTDFLDIRDDVDAQAGNDERGLLGMGFHPDYASNGRFFVFYTPTGSTTTVAEYKVSDGNPYVADPNEVDDIFTWDDNPERNHVGGMIAFGSDDMLYVGIGDGGGGGDQHGEVGNGLNKKTVLGKILRFDVDNGPSYAATDNPFVGEEDGDDNIWAYGLRNPWRFSFDSANGDLFIGDVGQNRWEEIDLAKAGESGLNFGWRAYEANEVFDHDPGTLALAQNHTPPLIEVRQEQADGPLLRDAVSITGGYVYRGTEIPELQGVYLFGDFGSEDVAGIRRCGASFSEPERIADLSRLGNGVSSFGQDNAGEMYIVYYASGVVKKIVEAN